MGKRPAVCTQRSSALPPPTARRRFREDGVVDANNAIRPQYVTLDRFWIEFWRGPYRDSGTQFSRNAVRLANGMAAQNRGWRQCSCSLSRQDDNRTDGHPPPSNVVKYRPHGVTRDRSGMKKGYKTREASPLCSESGIVVKTEVATRQADAYDDARSRRQP